MAVTATSQTLSDGPKLAVIHFTGAIHTADSDESAVVKVDVSALRNSPSKVKIMQVWYMTDGISVDLLFDATTNILAFSCPNTESGHLDFRSFGGIQNNAGAGVTGDIVATTRSGSVGDTYSIVLEVSKS